MAATCPNGHTSDTDDYCDTCGARIGAASPVAVAAAPAAVEEDGPGEPCPECGAARIGQAMFCEGCGYDFATAKARRPPASEEAIEGAPALEVVVTADRAYFDRIAAEGVEFPAYFPSRTFALRSGEITIGRPSASRGIQPEIDLSGPPLDPAVSHLQAILIRDDRGLYSLIDPGSSNGISINDDPMPIPPNEPMQVRAGDRIHVGAWTTLTLRAAGGDPRDD
jgi:FHA domain-containing protein